MRTFLRILFDPDILCLLLVMIATLYFCIPYIQAAEVRTVRLDQTTVAKISVTPGRSTVLSFPTKPTKVILGNQGGFAVEYVESDLAIAALSSHSYSNLFVYLEGRRFAFDLITVAKGGDTLVLVRDAEDGPTPMPTPKRRTHYVR